MDKRFSQWKSGKILAAAAASVGLAGLASKADASLLIDVRATAVSGTAGSTVAPGGKTVTYAGGTITVTMNVFARVSGTNATQQTGEFGGGGGDDIRNDDRVQTVVGSFQSAGGLLGNLGVNAVAGTQVSPNTRTTPFGASGSTNGFSQDWDTDGDLDIGATGTDPTFMYAARAAAPSATTVWGPNATNFTPGNKGWSDDQGGAGGNNQNSIIDPTTAEIQIGTLRFVTDGSGGPNTLVNFVPRPLTGTESALWFEDGIATGKTPGTGAFGIGAPVNVTAVPEPATLGLLGIASLGLLARRRDNKTNA